MKFVLFALLVLVCSLGSAQTLTAVETERIKMVFDRYIQTSITSSAITSLTDFVLREVSTSRNGNRVATLTGVACLQWSGLGSRGGYLACTATIEEFSKENWVLNGYASCSVLSRLEYEDLGSGYHRDVHVLQCPGEKP